MFSVIKRNYFFDCDPAGIMFFGNAFKTAHACYEDWLLERGLTGLIFHNENLAFPVMTSTAKYHAPVKHMEEISVSLEAKQIKTYSYELNFMVKDSSGRRLFEVNTVHVCVNRADFSKQALPAELKSSLEKELII